MRLPDGWLFALRQDPKDRSKIVLYEIKIVRCYNCKYWTACESEENDCDMYGMCCQINRMTTFDWFCADGESKAYGKGVRDAIKDVRNAPTVGGRVSVKDDEDLISRAAAIAEIEDYIEEYSDVDPETGLHSPKWCAMEEAKDVLVKLPAAHKPGRERDHLREESKIKINEEDVDDDA